MKMSALSNSLSFPIHIATGEALRRARVAGATSASSTTICEYPLGEDHPLAHLFGKYANDPAWGDLDDIIKRNRTREDAEPEIE